MPAALSERPAVEAAVLTRVLMVDDSAAIRTLARFTLSAKRGFDIVGEAANGTEALAMYETHRPDCVVLDIDMPGMDGFEALAALRSAARAARDHAVRAHRSSGHRAALSGGAVACLEKSSQLASRRHHSPSDHEPGRGGRPATG